MRKTLILVVDRDDDFGFKAGVKSPVIGMEECTRAATALGIADPEDSDTNALFAALNLYKEMSADPDAGDLEVALICGHQKVGYKSDTILVKQLEEVLDKVHPDRAVLVGDGAEDEYIYPIITSRVPIDSVRKVYVKQAPGVEGTLYIVKRMLEDPQKRERFIAPISWVLMIICGIYIVSNLLIASSITNFVATSTTMFILFFVGLLLAFYSYNLEERLADYIRLWRGRARHGSIAIVFLVAAALILIVGLVISLYSLGDIYTNRDTERVLLFLVYAEWFVCFALMVYYFGLILDGYIYSRKLKYSYVTSILNIVSVGLICNGILDYLLDYVDMYDVGFMVYFVEIVAGFALALVASALQVKIRHVYMQSFPSTEEVDGDEIH